MYYVRNYIIFMFFIITFFLFFFLCNNECIRVSYIENKLHSFDMNNFSGTMSKIGDLHRSEKIVSSANHHFIEP